MHVITRKRRGTTCRGRNIPYARAALSALVPLDETRQRTGRSWSCARRSRARTSYGKLTVFKFCGGYIFKRSRLIAALHFNRGKVYIRAVLTHKEYDTQEPGNEWYRPSPSNCSLTHWPRNFRARCLVQARR